LKDYDYSMCGYYFVTLCTQNKECFFGDITKEKMELNNAGFMVQEVWKSLSERFAGVKIDFFIIMPNHMHGIIIISGDMCRGGCEERLNRGKDSQSKYGKGFEYNRKGNRGESLVGEHKVCPYSDGHCKVLIDEKGNFFPAGTTGGSIGRILQAFKSITTHKYIEGVKNSGWRAFPGKLWQRNYYDRIIRNEKELSQIREYITNNPLKWNLDKENPEVFKEK